MTRLLTNGNETADVGTIGNTGTVTTDTTHQNTGAQCWSVPLAEGTFNFKFFTVVGGATSVDYYARAYIRTDVTVPAASSMLQWVTSGGASIARLNYDTNGTMSVIDAAAAAHASTIHYALGAYDCLELHINVNPTTAAAGTLEGRCNNATIYSSGVGAGNCGTVAPSAFRWLHPGAHGDVTYADDVAINDGAGGGDNITWVGLLLDAVGQPFAREFPQSHFGPF